MRFQADCVEYWSRDGVETVFFGQADKELALTLASIPGTAGHYLEWNSQSNACVDGVKAVRLSGRVLQLQLTPKAAKLLAQPGFEVELDCTDTVFHEISSRLPLIFGKKFAVKRPTGPSKKVPQPPQQQDLSRVRYLNLEFKNLKSLPEDVARMTSLETAKLAGNPLLDFHAVCEVLSQLPSLKQLSFTTSQPVPENIGKLGRLESLHLDGFTTPQCLPASFGQLTRLNYLLIMSPSEVVLPESFAQLADLAQLHVRAASWRLPAQFYRLSKLTQLDFGNCQLNRVPEEMAGMTGVASVFFTSPNHDYSQILPVVARMPNLKRLELAANPVPRAIGLCRRIEELTISTAACAEAPLQLPDELFDLAQLKILNLSMNRFDRIPDAIGRLKALEELVFIESDFETLPDSVGDLSNLTVLNISENPSLRELPESLGRLTRLRTLLLDDNPRLTRLPHSLRNLTNLEGPGQPIP